MESVSAFEAGGYGFESCLEYANGYSIDSRLMELEWAIKLMGNFLLCTQGLRVRFSHGPLRDSVIATCQPHKLCDYGCKSHFRY